MPGDISIQIAPLETCSDALDCLGQGAFFEALATRVGDVIGIVGFMMIVGVVTYIALYYWSKSYVVPTVVLVLSGGIILGLMPAVVARVAWIIILLAGGLGLFGILWAVIR